MEEQYTDIFSHAASSLPSGHIIRPLRKTDYSRGFLTCLSDLTWIGSVDEAAFDRQFDWLATQGKDWYHCIVIDDGNRIIGTATMIVERKFIQSLAMVAHVEEVSVVKACQGKGFGRVLITTLNAIAKAMGVRRMILDCSEHNIEFYEKCSYEKAGQQMSLEHLSGKD